MTFCRIDTPLWTRLATEQNAATQETKQNPTSKGSRDVKIKHSELRKCPGHSYLYVLIPFAVGVHTSKKHHIYTAKAQKYLPTPWPLAAASFQTPHTPPRMWVWQCTSTPNASCIFLCSVCSGPR